MIIPDRLSLGAALAVGATAMAAFIVSLFNAQHSAVSGGGAAARVASASQTVAVQSIEGGVQASGYLDGRPVPSGFTMPVVIRYHPPEADQTPPVGKAPPVEASAMVQ